MNEPQPPLAVEVVTLGRFAVFVGGGEVAGITAQPVRAALLVYLAVEREVTRDAVLAASGPSTTRHAPVAR